MVNHITIILVDDHALMRDGIRSILEQVPGIKVVAEAENGRDAIELASIHAPDIMLIDISMPDLNGMEACKKIHAIDPKIGIIALSMHSDERYVTRMLEAGAMGYLLKTCDSDELLRAITAVQRGKLYVTSDLTHALINRRHTSGKQSVTQTGSPPLDVLTPREREVLQLIAEGSTSKEIGTKLDVAIKTIETHRTNIIRKLDIHSIAELTKYAVREGLTALAE